jgi:hypothetical protein
VHRIYIVCYPWTRRRPRFHTQVSRESRALLLYNCIALPYYIHCTGPVRSGPHHLDIIIWVPDLYRYRYRYSNGCGGPFPCFCCLPCLALLSHACVLLKISLHQLVRVCRRHIAHQGLHGLDFGGRIVIGIIGQLAKGSERSHEGQL